MADVRDVPFLRLPHEWLEALVAFRRLSGVDHNVLMVVLHETWGKGREHAEIGMALLETRVWGADRKAIQKSLRRLSSPPTADGWGLLEVVQDHTDTTGRVYRPVRDYERWAWEEAERPRLAHLRAFYVRRYAEIERKSGGDRYSEAAHIAFSCLVDAIKKTNPEAAQIPEDRTPTWYAWMRALEELASRYAIDDIAPTIESLPSHKFFSQRIAGDKAADRLVQHFDELMAHRAAVEKDRANRRKTR